MSEVAQLEIHATQRDEDSDADRLSLSARLEAVLDDGRHVVLLADRGWVTSGIQNRDEALAR